MDTTTGEVDGRSRNLILAAMIFAVSMTFIDQTIVSIAVPNIQKELDLTSTGVQWAVAATRTHALPPKRRASPSRRAARAE